MHPYLMLYIKLCVTSTIIHTFPSSCIFLNNFILAAMPSRPFGIQVKLSTSFGDELSTFIDANHTCCLCTCHSTSVYFILFNGVVISWSCKKQSQIALHSTGSEVTALHHGTFKTVLLQSFLQSIGIYLNTPTPTYEDNQETIKLVRTHHLTDTVRHHDVKIAWLIENFDNDQLKLAYTKTTMMFCDCTTKPSNGAKLFDQISYAIGQRFYPPPDQQYYHDLCLHEYSYLYRFPKEMVDC
jgi:hypothetical protein